jgi:hypothetical protein
LGIWLAVTHREAILRFLAGAAIVFVPFCTVNLLAYRRLLPPYFLGNSFAGHPHVQDALAGNLFSPARGLFVFSPILALAIAGLVIKLRHRALDALDVTVAVIVVVHWLVISSLPHWWGGWQYGPRLFADVIPYLTVLMVPAIVALLSASRTPLWRLGAVATVALGTFSVFANAEAALFPATACWNVQPNVDAHPSRVWDWGDAQVLSGFRGVRQVGIKREIVAGGFSAHGFLVDCPPGAA